GHSRFVRSKENVLRLESKVRARGANHESRSVQDGGVFQANHHRHTLIIGSLSHCIASKHRSQHPFSSYIDSLSLFGVYFKYFVCYTGDIQSTTRDTYRPEARSCAKSQIHIRPRASVQTLFSAQFK